CVAPAFPPGVSGRLRGSRTSVKRVFGEELRYYKNHSQDASTSLRYQQFGFEKEAKTAVGATFVSTVNLSIC
ncbi:hypothetical protein, partial [Brucella oryzae]|uniref:hypothetical protein n=1 Tax=Brucella oryzae TaxID=335286 RepID=UPI001AC0023B